MRGKRTVANVNELNTKGWLQTLLVLARDLPAVVRELGAWRALVVALLLTNLVTGPLLTPLFLVLVVADLARHGLPAPSGAAEIAEATLAFAVIALGGMGTLWCGLVGARACGIACRRSVAAFLPYQLLIAVAAWGGLIDLVRRPYHWHKTAHGEAGRVTPRRPRSGWRPNNHPSEMATGHTSWAEDASTGVSTVKDFEGGRRKPIASTLRAMRAALEAQKGVLEDDDVFK